MTPLSTLLKSLVLTLLLTGSAFAADKVNINTADAATIDRVLLNIGPSKAEAIVAYRKANGAFKSADQLALVKGIGLKTIEKNRDRIVFAGAAAASSSAVPQRPRRPRRARPPPHGRPSAESRNGPGQDAPG